MKKKLIAILIAISAIISCAFALSACYQTTTKDGLIIETLRFYDKCWVKGVKDKGITQVVIPAKYRGKTVTGISEYAFSGCEELTAITIPQSVTSIGTSAFNNCKALTDITIP